MARYRMNPVIVEAFRFAEEDDPEWFREHRERGRVRIGGLDWPKAYIKTPRGTQVAEAGDWIIQHSSGVMEVCDADDFGRRYIPVPE